MQHALIRMLEKWKRSLDNGESTRAIVMDFSKAFDYIEYYLLIAKLDAYGISHEALSCQRFILEIGSREFRPMDLLELTNSFPLDFHTDRFLVPFSLMPM